MTEWVVLAYLLPLAGLALPSGRWLDRVGQRPALVFSLTGFAISVRAEVAGAEDGLVAGHHLDRG
jgi:MFS family permease